MKTKLIISEQPKCKTCGVLMGEWNLFADEYEHIECSADRISDILIEMVRNDLNEK